MVVGIGIDSVDVVSFREKFTDDLAEELFLPDEIEYCRSQVRYWENFAARFAAKEAAFKALGAGLSSGLLFKDVEVVRCAETGSISLALYDKALSVQISKEITVLHVSISHTARNAVAIVVAESRPV